MEQVAREGNFDVKIDNVTDDLGVMSVAGPLSKNVFAKATGDEALVTKWKFLDAKKVSRTVLFIKKKINIYLVRELLCNYISVQSEE